MGVSHSIWSPVEMLSAYSVACYSSKDQKAETGFKWKQVGTRTFKGQAAYFLQAGPTS